MMTEVEFKDKRPIQTPNTICNSGLTLEQLSDKQLYVMKKYWAKKIDAEGRPITGPQEVEGE